MEKETEPVPADFPRTRMRFPVLSRAGSGCPPEAALGLVLSRAPLAGPRCLCLLSVLHGLSHPVCWDIYH